MKARGFTLVELMIVVAIIAILAAIAIPNMLRYRMLANETNAAGAMRTISNAEEGFKTGVYADANGDGIGDYGTLAQLADPTGAGDVPGFIDETLASGQKHGYQFVLNVTPGSDTVLSTYDCVASPLVPGRSGIRRYFVNETGVIRFTADGSTPTEDSPPLN